MNPNLTVVNKVVAKNAQIAPKAKSNNTVVEKKSFSMAHLHKTPQSLTTSLLELLNLNTASKNTNGVIKGNTVDGGSFHLTPGVLKFKKGKAPAAPAPAPTNQAPTYPAPANPAPVTPAPANQTPANSY